MSYRFGHRKKNCNHRTTYKNAAGASGTSL